MLGRVFTGGGIFFQVEESLPKDVSLSEEKSLPVTQSFRRRILIRFEMPLPEEERFLEKSSPEGVVLRNNCSKTKFTER